MKKLILILLLGSGLTAFSQDSTNTFDYNYKKGIAHYNQGVKLINNDGVKQQDVKYIDSISVVAKGHFNQALPFLQKAYSIKSKDENTLKALQGVYFGLNDQERSDRYKKELEALKK